MIYLELLYKLRVAQVDGLVNDTGVSITDGLGWSGSDAEIVLPHKSRVGEDVVNTAQHNIPDAHQQTYQLQNDFANNSPHSHNC